GGPAATLCTGRSGTRAGHYLPGVNAKCLHSSSKCADDRVTVFGPGCLLRLGVAPAACVAPERAGYSFRHERRTQPCSVDVDVRQPPARLVAQPADDEGEDEERRLQEHDRGATGNIDVEAEIHAERAAKNA